MSVKVRGKLTIKYRNGRNGKFPVGDLICDIGEFSVKSKEFEQYSEGTYEGEFVIARIEMASYTYKSSVNSYLSAKLDDFSIDNYQTGKIVEPEPVVPDPADDEVETSPHDQSKDLGHIDDDAVDSNTDSDLILFGDEIYQPLINGSNEVKLDPSVGRTVLRQQADRMKQLGYRWEATRQIWLKK
jgi:hypothetical protein